MATALEPIGPRAGTAPLTYTLTDPVEVDITSIFAHFDGAAASGAFRTVVTIRAQNGAILARVFPTSDTLTTGDTADVTFAPFLRGESDAGGSTQIVYDYTLTADAAAIDTATDGPDAGVFPTGFAMLELWVYVRTTEVALGSAIQMQINGDAAANYDRRYLSGFESAGVDTVITQSQVGTTSLNLSSVHGASAPANYFSVLRATMPGYSARAGYLSIEGQHAKPSSASVTMLVAVQAMGWRSTSAVQSLSIYPAVAGVKLLTGTRVIAYGR